ncbi:ImmA/IrrE family metallo-endopeptidase [Janthinobacterium sp. SUN100]|uniref:ImmA/IrrE family metallo-endopeptidase n=1 Tax=Janthinobacterium sp. SUN100 TaxID=3004101 RepID=UPI0025B0A8C0|nr:ImmA/IrrE family metallo-endopeptidase [Janthinobacterium sp. SUN100]MDN2705024.1 ImmA/IrrE family metallo-endopeptidase [Janthinobacterium sp. SUN100]
METLELSPAVLDWAAAQVGEHLGDLAQKISKRSADKIKEGTLTYPQVLKYAKLARVPLGYLFLDEPPEVRKTPLADFRTVPDAHPLSKDFFDVYDDIDFKQSWFKERLVGLGAEPLAFVGKYRAKRPTVETLATEIRTTINFKTTDLHTVPNPDQHFGLLSEKCERAGILIFKNGVVGNSNKRSLSVSEFRGFVIADEYCPVIFINGADAPAAWVFTLAHELAHIWLGDSSISDVNAGNEHEVEKYCNAVAGEILVPTEEFLRIWSSEQGLSSDTQLDNIRKHFKVSKTVAARKAFDLSFISRHNYFQVYESARQAAKAKAQDIAGGDFYRTLAVRNSKFFSMEVANLAVGGEITLAQAGRLLNANPNKVVKLFEKRNAISI